jgi:hypothetical protein
MAIPAERTPPRTRTVIPAEATRQAQATLTSLSEKRQATWIAQAQTPLPTRTLLPVQATQRAQATREVRRWATSAAQTQTAIAPTPLALRSGYVECSKISSRLSCWHGVVNNRIIELGIDMPQRTSFLDVDTYRLDHQLISSDTYRLPVDNGYFYIQAVTGPIVTLMNDNGQTSVTFDLTARQWGTLVPQPSPTLVVGLSAECSTPKNSRDAMISTCWRGYANGRATTVEVGRGGIEWGSGNEEPHGLLDLWIDRQQTDLHNITMPVKYSSGPPINIGTLGIVSVKDLRLTLIGIEPSAPAGRLIFDLATRWWRPPNVQLSQQLTAGAVECQPILLPNTAQYLYNCWRGKINGKLIGLDAGRQSARSGYNGKAPPLDYDIECCQGILRVTTYNQDQSITASEVYSTPQQVGAVYIAALKDTRIMLAPYDPQLKDAQFVFDLTTRRWISSPIQPTTAWNLQPVQCNGSYINTVPRFASCWAGIRNGTVVSVRSGRSVAYNEPQQGILSLFVGLTYAPYDPGGIYKTPAQVGTVRIVAIKANGLVTLAPIDPQYARRTFVFNLNTRQWITPELGWSRIEAP